MLRYNIIATFQRLIYAFVMLPWRLWRLVRHPFSLFRKPLGTWSFEALILIIEVLGLPEILETVWDWVYWRSRPLTAQEVALAQSVFGDSIRYDRVRVNERERIFSKRAATAYVTFYTINYWGKMSNGHFLHELAHVWQYQHLGTRYMLWAIQGQHSEKGYNYGGEAALLAHQKIGLRAFNLEQQADIVSDYYQLKNNFGTRWISRNPQFLPLFEPYIAELRGRS